MLPVLTAVTQAQVQAVPVQVEVEAEPGCGAGGTTRFRDGRDGRPDRDGRACGGVKDTGRIGTALEFPERLQGPVVPPSRLVEVASEAASDCVPIAGQTELHHVFLGVAARAIQRALEILAVFGKLAVDKPAKRTPVRGRWDPAAAVSINRIDTHEIIEC